MMTSAKDVAKMVGQALFLHAKRAELEQATLEEDLTRLREEQVRVLAKLEELKKSAPKKEMCVPVMDAYRKVCSIAFEAFEKSLKPAPNRAKANCGLVLGDTQSGTPRSSVGTENGTPSSTVHIIAPTASAPTTPSFRQSLHAHPTPGMASSSGVSSSPDEIGMVEDHEAENPTEGEKRTTSPAAVEPESGRKRLKASGALDLVAPETNKAQPQSIMATNMTPGDEASLGASGAVGQRGASMPEGRKQNEQISKEKQGEPPGVVESESNLTRRELDNRPTEPTTPLITSAASTTEAQSQVPSQSMTAPTSGASPDAGSRTPSAAPTTEVSAMDQRGVNMLEDHDERSESGKRLVVRDDEAPSAASKKLKEDGGAPAPSNEDEKPADEQEPESNQAELESRTDNGQTYLAQPMTVPAPSATNTQLFFDTNVIAGVDIVEALEFPWGQELILDLAEPSEVGPKKGLVGLKTTEAPSVAEEPAPLFLPGQCVQHKRTAKYGYVYTGASDGVQLMVVFDDSQGELPVEVSPSDLCHSSADHLSHTFCNTWGRKPNLEAETVVKTRPGQEGIVQSVVPTNDASDTMYKVKLIDAGIKKLRSMGLSVVSDPGEKLRIEAKLRDKFAFKVESWVRWRDTTRCGKVIGHGEIQDYDQGVVAYAMSEHLIAIGEDGRDLVKAGSATKAAYLESFRDSIDEVKSTIKEKLKKALKWRPMRLEPVDIATQVTEIILCVDKDPEVQPHLLTKAIKEHELRALVIYGLKCVHAFAVLEKCKDTFNHVWRKLYASEEGEWSDTSTARQRAKFGGLICKYHALAYLSIEQWRRKPETLIYRAVAAHVNLEDLSFCNLMRQYGSGRLGDDEAEDDEVVHVAHSAKTKKRSRRKIVKKTK